MANQMFDFGPLGIGLQCVRYVQGQPVGVVPMTGSPAADLSEKQPGNAENYLDGAFFALISQNDILTINAGQNGASLRTFLHGLFRNAELEEDATKFDLARIAAVDQLRIRLF